MNSDNHASTAEFDRFVQTNADIAELETFIVDVNGHALGKRIPIAQGRRTFGSGISFSACAPILDCRGRGHDPAGIGGSDGDPDGIALPLADSLCRVPWAKAPTAQVMCAMQTFDSRAPLWFDPRVVLQGVLSECAAQGIRAVVACELEFYLVDRIRTEEGKLKLAANARTHAAPRRPMNLSLECLEDNADFLSQVVTAARVQRIPLAGSVAEYGLGQYEVNLRHVPDPLLAADHAVLLKRLVRGIARANDMDATFMAKPFLDQPGSGLHVHISLIDEEGDSRFSAPGGDELLQQAVAGMQALMFDSIALFAPNFNSHRRFSGPFVPTTATWGYNNRSVAMRIPAAGGPDLRIEHRVAGADASPHLVVAAILAAVLHGITNRLQPSAPTYGRVQGGRDPSFPTGLLNALDRMERSSALSQYLSKPYIEAYAHLKRGEYDALCAQLSPRELDFYA
jgi:glutamine synthetase